MSSAVIVLLVLLSLWTAAGALRKERMWETLTRWLFGQSAEMDAQPRPFGRTLGLSGPPQSAVDPHTVTTPSLSPETADRIREQSLRERQLREDRLVAEIRGALDRTASYLERSARSQERPL